MVKAVLATLLGAFLTGVSIAPVAHSETFTAQLVAQAPQTLLGGNKYESFPYVVRSARGGLVGVFSVSEDHGYQTVHTLGTMASGGGWSFVPLFDQRQLSPAARAALLSVLDDGETVLLKAWWFKREGGNIRWLRSEVQEGDISLWGKPLFLGNLILRPGYTTRTEARGVAQTQDQRAVLLESTDGGQRWRVRSTILQQPGRRFTEAAIVQVGQRSLLAVVREQIVGQGGRRPQRLHVLRSDNEGLSWVPQQYGGVELSGTQPELLRLRSGPLVFCAGDRSGASGLNRSGAPTNAADATGIHCYSSADDGRSWRDSGMMARSISTDTGQPQIIELSDRRVLLVYYLRRSDARRADVEQIVVPERTLLGQ